MKKVLGPMSVMTLAVLLLVALFSQAVAAPITTFTLLNPPQPVPSVADGMRKADATEMKNAWNKWVELLQRAVGQDFALAVVAESQPTTAATTTKAADKE